MFKEIKKDSVKGKGKGKGRAVRGNVYLKKKKCIQGKNASNAGRRLEDFVEDVLNSKGTFSVRYSKLNDEKSLIPSFINKILYKQVPYTKLWGGKGYSDFVLETPERKTRIDVRSQEVRGSVEEKIPYLFQTAEKCYPEDEVVIVLDGKGVRPEIREWLIGMANSVKHKTIKVLTKEQFKDWANNI